MLKEMEGALGIAPEIRLEQLDTALRGQRIREVALELLKRQAGPDNPIHYREWFALLQDAGHHIAGKNPLATFLAQVNRAPEIEQLGQRSGLYQLRRTSTHEPTLGRELGPDEHIVQAA